MKKPGYIRFIDNKVKFEYYELEKPDIDDYVSEFLDGLEDFYQAEREYEASKRVIEVSNATYKTEKVFVPPMSEDIIDKYIIEDLKTFGKQRIYGDESCEAEVTDNIATIIKIN